MFNIILDVLKAAKYFKKIITLTREHRTSEHRTLEHRTLEHGTLEHRTLIIEH